MTAGAAEVGGAVGQAVVRHAVVVATRGESLAVVGGLPLAVRAVLALRAAGFTSIDVVAGRQAAEIAAGLDRRGVGGAPVWGPHDPGPAPRPCAEPVLVVAGDVLFDAGALAPLLATAGCGRLRVARRAGFPEDDVRALVCPWSAVPGLLAALDGGRRTVAEALRELSPADETPVWLGDGLFAPLDPVHSPQKLTAVLLDHLGRRAAGTDGYLARLIDRHLSRGLTRGLLGWPVTPNHVTLVSIGLGLVGAAGLASVSHWGQLGGVLVLLVSSLLDGVDGEMARARFEQTATGARLDLTGDYVVNLATFVGLGIGLARQALSRARLSAVLVLLGGVAAATAMMHGLINRPVLARSDDLHEAVGEPGLRGTWLTTVIERVAGRDYLYLLLVFALAGHLEWFVYAAAGGSWLFVSGVLAYWAYRRSRETTGGAPASNNATSR